MPSPVLHLLAGPNGAGKSTFANQRLIPLTHLPFVNADEIAKERWPGHEEVHAYDASQAAATERDDLLRAHASFITETVFSHESKLGLVRDAVALRYYVHLHVILIPVDATVKRVEFRVRQGGHTVPEEKVRDRYARLWTLVAEARDLVARATFYDNTKVKEAFRTVAEYEYGMLVYGPDWPTWTPSALSDPGPGDSAATESR